MNHSTEEIGRFFFRLFTFSEVRGKGQLFLVAVFHMIAWTLFFLLPFLFYQIVFISPEFIWKEAVNKFFLVLLFYGNFFLFIPKYLQKKKFIPYFGMLLLCIFLLLLQQLSLDNFLFRQPSFLLPGTTATHDSLSRDHLLPREEYRFTVGATRSHAPLKLAVKSDFIFSIPLAVFFLNLSNVISSSLLIIFLGIFIRLALSFYRHQEEKKALENANLNAEVNFLKSQINPHFLFNTLNTIYVQAHKRSDKTESSILKLSQMLRYVIYESGTTKIALAKDLEYLASYIDLQRLRISDKVAIEYQVNGRVDGLMICPLLLITFVENAFKHGISYLSPDTIRVQIDISGKTLVLQVQNSIHRQMASSWSGVGLQNARRRLELLYPGEFWLTAHETEGKYFVHLTINL